MTDLHQQIQETRLELERVISLRVEKQAELEQCNMDCVRLRMRLDSLERERSLEHA